MIHRNDPLFTDQPAPRPAEVIEFAKRLFAQREASVENAIIDSCEPPDERSPYIPTPKDIKEVTATIRQTWSRTEHCRRLTDIDASWYWFLSQFHGQNIETGSDHITAPRDSMIVGRNLYPTE